MEEINIVTPVQPSKKKPGWRLGVFSLVVVLLAISFLSGYVVAVLQLPSAPLANVTNLAQFRDQSEQLAKERGIDFNLFWDVWDRIYAEHIDKATIKAEDLLYGAISGMVDAVGDPHTVFLKPADNKEFTQELSGAFEGIGAEIGIKDKKLIIVAPLTNSPAEKAGLRAGDYIVAIDGVDTYGLTLDAAVGKIKGKKGTEVTLTVIHKEDGSTAENIKIVRDKIDVPSVEWSMDDNNIAIIKIVTFNQDSSKSFVKALTEVIKKDPQGLIIDLRNDPGGFLVEAVDIASAWVPENEVVVREVFTDASKNEDYRAKKQLAVPKVPTIVLINEGSASASEILAGALQDYELATIVGVKSFGKGSVQDLEQLAGGSALKISVAKWLTPKGRSIQDQGIEPDFVVELTPEDFDQDKDPQLDKAKELILKDY